MMITGNDISIVKKTLVFKCSVTRGDKQKSLDHWIIRERALSTSTLLLTLGVRDFRG
jgi:hypothetical protein